jgi:uncharacterized protein DUF4224
MPDPGEGRAVNMFLTDSELEYYTGYKQAAAQIRFLQKWRVRHVINGAGRPRVTWDAVNGAEKPRTAPNFAALKAAS